MQMHPNLIKRWDALQYEWMNSWKPITPYKCCYVHDTPCLYEFIRKVLTVCRIGVKYYIFFHIVPLILRIKKARSPHEKGRVALRTLIEYCKSILFMGFLVGLSKGALCIKNNLSLPFDGFFATWQSGLASASIFWEERSRQREIGYFILAKAVRSVYMMVKRLGWLKVSGEAVWMHMLLMAAFSYVYHHYPDNLKYHSTFALIWGKD